MPRGIIDADAHVIESIRTWTYLRDNEKKYLPMMVTQTYGNELKANDGNTRKEFWVIDDRIHTRHRNVDNSETTQDQRECTDLEGRLRQMDGMGVDIQVLFPTLFLSPVTQRQDMYFALSRSYNRWMADLWKESNGRLRWVAIPPLPTMDKVQAELEFARDNGACGVFMRGFELERRLPDPYFFPLYETAQKLDLPMCLHSGNSSPWHIGFFRDETSGFIKFKSPAVGAFQALLLEDIPPMFPALRWAFVELSASFIPYVMNNLDLSFHKLSGVTGKSKDRTTKDIMKRNNFYVACQVTDDLPYILQYAGPDNLVIGTDYGHADTATEIQAMQKLKGKNELPAEVIDKILIDNPRRVYGLN